MKPTKTAPACDSDEPQDWEIDGDVSTLARAEEIKADPKRWARAKKRAGERAAEMKKVAEAPAAKK